MKAKYPYFLNICLGTTYGGLWDNWYGPSGREKNVQRAQLNEEIHKKLVKILNNLHFPVTKFFYN